MSGYKDKKGEHDRIYSREYYSNNKEKIKKYYQDNKDRIRERMNKYYQDNKEKFAERGRLRDVGKNKERCKMYRLNNKKKIKSYYSQFSMRKNSLMYKYKLSIDDYNKIFNEQNGICTICGNEIKSVFMEHNKLNCAQVDHNHKTNCVRGILCRHCNHLIGNARDDIKILLSAIKYLEQWQN